MNQRLTQQDNQADTQTDTQAQTQAQAMSHSHLSHALAIVQEARSWLGTPFHHQGRCKGVGVDCAGLVIAVAKALGLSDFDTQDYTPVPDGQRLECLCHTHLQHLPLEQLAPGDVLLFRFDQQPQHLAIAADHLQSGLSLIHAYLPARKVVEVRLDARWRQRLVAAFRMVAR